MKIEKNNNIVDEYKNNNIKAQKADIKTDKKNQEQKKKLVIALTSLAAIGAAGIVIGANVKKGKLPQKLANIKFESGIARDKSGNLFTGIINDKLKNGDLVQLTYKNGVIQSSTRQGTQNFSKTYSRGVLGDVTKITTQKDGNIIEFIKTKYGHIIKENSKLKKAFIRKNSENIVTDFTNGKPLSSKFFIDSVKTKEKIYKYDANNNLTNVSLTDNHNHLLSETTFDKDKITIKNSNPSTDSGYSTIITKGENQEFGADLSVIKTTDMGVGSQRRYFKNGKIIYDERVVSKDPIETNVCSRQNEEGCINMMEVFDYRQNPNPQAVQERVYDSGARDILISGKGFQDPFEFQQLDSNGKTVGYIKSEILPNGRIRTTQFNADHKKMDVYDSF